MYFIQWYTDHWSYKIDNAAVWNCGVFVPFIRKGVITRPYSTDTCRSVYLCSTPCQFLTRGMTAPINYLGRSESRNIRSMYHKRKIFTLCFVATLCVCKQRSICQLYARQRCAVAAVQSGDSHGYIHHVFSLFRSTAYVTFNYKPAHPLASI